jgi:flavin-dependent dehydrogenase
MMAGVNKEKIAIIGAGIAGLYLGWRLRQKGYEVVILEKKDKIGGKACTALVSERIKEYLPIGNDIYGKKVDSVLVHFPKKDIRIKINPAYLVFEREVLDDFVFNLAKNAGVEIIFNKEINEIPKDYTRIIGCDGALSKIRKLSNLPNTFCRLGIQCFTDEGDFSGETIEVWPKKFNHSPKYGFLWKVLKNKRIEYGIIGLNKESQNEFSDFLTKQGVNISSERFRAALIPQRLCVPKSNRITLLGDSAGMTKPTTGGGIIWGFKAGDILTDCFPNFGKYRRKTIRFFRIKILKGKLAASVSYFLGNYFPFLLPREISIDPDLF